MEMPVTHWDKLQGLIELAKDSERSDIRVTMRLGSRSEKIALLKANSFSDDDIEALESDLRLIGNTNGTSWWSW